MSLTVQHLVDARAILIEEKFWTKGIDEIIQWDDPDDMSNQYACYCAGGALAKAIFDDSYKMYEPEAQGYLRKFAELAGLPAQSEFLSREEFAAERVHIWNDASERTYEDVIQAIDRAIERLSEDSH